MKSITILNSWLWPLKETEPQMLKQKWLLTFGIFPVLYRYLNFSPRFLYKLGWGSKRSFMLDRHRSYIRQFPRKKDRSGVFGFLVALFDFDNPCWQQDETVGRLKNLPVQIIWGVEDKLISIRNLARWRRLLPGADVRELHGVGHFVAEESPEEVVKYVDEFIGKNNV